jgi:monoamine oxidase
MSRAMNRRRFLRLSAAAVPLSAGLAACRHVDTQTVVVGAGLAGLHAADVLRRAGREVIVLEAQDRPGGRVRTLRAPLDEELYGEAGAIRIPDKHRLVRDLATRHGLNLIPFDSGNGTAVVSAGGIVARMPSEIDRLGRALALRPDEAGLSPRALLLRYTDGVPPDLGRPAVDEAAYRAWAPIDRQSWPDWLRSRGASPGAVALMTVGGDSRELSALYVLRQFALLRDVTQYYKILGGMDQLPRAMADALGPVVRYNAPVVRIAQHNGGADVDYLDGGTPRRLRADRVIVAVPFATLRRIEVEPPFSAPKSRAVATLPYFPATRGLLQTTTRFWHVQGLSGTARTDQPIETWDASYEQLAERGLVAATAGGAIGRALATMDDATAIQRMAALVSEPFPAMEGAFEKGIVYRWATDRWAQGAFAVFGVSEMTALAPVVAAPEGRVHFAGEHTSPWMGWMEGALESGQRAAGEVTEAS